MSNNDQIDLGKPVVALGLGVGLKGQHCKCGRLLSQSDHGLCPYCRAGGTSPIETPMAIPVKQGEGNSGK